mgnify:CR=1 FL=1
MRIGSHKPKANPATLRTPIRLRLRGPEVAHVGQSTKMKFKPNVLAVILAGIAVTTLVTVSLRNANSARMLGDVILPMQVMINDVLGASRAGNHDLVERKLEVLGQIFEDFKNKGTTPEMSVSKVTELK